MKAAEARQLQIGDWVRATFSGRGVVKSCEIIGIAWPKFTLKTCNYKGEEMIRTRRYESLGGRCDPETGQLATAQMPSWLTWPDSSR